MAWLYINWKCVFFITSTKCMLFFQFGWESVNSCKVSISFDSIWACITIKFYGLLTVTLILFYGYYILGYSSTCNT